MDFDENKNNEMNDLNKKVSHQENIIKKLKSELEEKNIILSRTKAYLFDLEYILDNKNNTFDKEKEELTKKFNNEKDEITRKTNKKIEEITIKSNKDIENITRSFNKEKEEITRKYSSKLESKNYIISTLESDVDNKEYEINYLKKNSFFKKLLSPLSYIYLLIKSKPNEFKTNIKLLKAFKEFGCFDVGYYLNNNGEVENSTVCRYFSPEIHYVIYGFENEYKFNKKYFNKKSKEELLNYIYYSKEPMP